MKISDILKSNKTQINYSIDINDNILIIDGTNNYKRCFSRASEISDNGYYVGGYVGFLKSIASIIRKLAPSRVIIVFDGAGGSLRRKNLYSDYKSNRLKIRKYNREMYNDTIDEQKSMEEQFKRLIMYLCNLPITLISIDNIEADDVISFIINKLSYKKATIVSTDKDFYQLVSDKVFIYNPITKGILTRDGIIDKYCVSPANFIYYKAILGDVSDNVTGVRGIGEKTLKTKFSFLSSYDRYDIDDIYKELDEKTLSKLKSDIDTFNRNIYLMDLSSPVIDVGSAMNVTNQYKDLSFSYTLDISKIKSYILTDGIARSFVGFDRWITESFGKLNSIIKK